MVTIANSRNNLKKDDIIKNIFLNVGISSIYSKKIVNDIIEILTLNLCLNKIVKVKNFGVFKLHAKNKRTGRNPKNKKPYIIDERIITTFRASEKLKLKINNNVQKKK